MRSEERSEERGTRLCGWGENELKTKNELKMKRKNIIFEGGREGGREGGDRLAQQLLKVKVVGRLWVNTKLVLVVAIILKV